MFCLVFFLRGFDLWVRMLVLKIFLYCVMVVSFCVLMLLMMCIVILFLRLSLSVLLNCSVWWVSLSCLFFLGICGLRFGSRLRINSVYVVWCVFLWLWWGCLLWYFLLVWCCVWIVWYWLKILWMLLLFWLMCRSSCSILKLLWVLWDLNSVFLMDGRLRWLLLLRISLFLLINSLIWVVIVMRKSLNFGRNVFFFRMFFFGCMLILMVCKIFECLVFLMIF